MERLRISFMEWEDAEERLRIVLTRFRRSRKIGSRKNYALRPSRKTRTRKTHASLSKKWGRGGKIPLHERQGMKEMLRVVLEEEEARKGHAMRSRER